MVDHFQIRYCMKREVSLAKTEDTLVDTLRTLNSSCADLFPYKPLRKNRLFKN